MGRICRGSLRSGHGLVTEQELAFAQVAEQIANIGGWSGFERERFIAHGMADRESGRVQGLPIDQRRGHPIHRVAGDRMSHSREVDADLVGTSGD